MSDLELKLYGKPLFLLPNPLPPVQIQQIHPQPLPNLHQPPLAPHNPWDQIVNTSLFPFPPPTIGLPNPMLDLVNMNAQLPLLPLPFNPLLPFGFPNPLLPMPKFPPVPLMSLRLATPPPFRSHPYRPECRSAETKENKQKRSRRNSEESKKKSNAPGSVAGAKRITQVIHNNDHFTAYRYTAIGNGAYRVHK